jgi:2-hydroxy-3-oxopropionate reductase
VSERGNRSLKIERIGFIGLGIMGRPMAFNLIKAGFKVTGYSRTSATRDEFAASGGEASGSVADATHHADMVITMLPDTPDVREVALGPEGVFESAAAGLLYCDMSTISPGASRELALHGRQRDVRVLDAPVSGGEVGAKEAALSIMVGGSAGDFERAKPVFDAMGKTVIHVGSSGAGQTVKAANQLIVAGTIDLVAEAIVLLKASDGVDVERAIEVMSGGLAGSRILERKARSMLAGDFKPGFRVDLHHKDLGIVLSTARDANVVLPVTAVVSQLMASLRANGEGSLDHTALLKVVERLSGRSPS